MKARLFSVMSLIASLALLLSPVGGVSSTVAEEQPASVQTPPPAPDCAQVTVALESSPVMFIENVGQFADGARFQVRGGNGTIWLADDALWITVVERSPVDTLGRFDVQRANAERDDEPLQCVNIKLSFVGANPHPRLEPFNRLDIRISSFIGSDPDQWHADVPVWGGVRYKDLYPGMDLEITGESGHYTQRLVAHPSADLSAVRLRVESADALALDGDRLRLTTAVGDFSLPLLTVEEATPNGQPTIFNVERGIFEVSYPFSLSPSPLVSLSPQDNPDDLLYSTFLGGSGQDAAWASVVDSSGALYFTYYTASSDFPTTAGAYDRSHNGSWDIFVARLSADGSQLLASTFVGGSNRDEGMSFALDGSGNVVVGGETWSSDFPTTAGAYDTTYNGGYADAIVFKLSADLSSLLYSTYLGGAPGPSDNGHDRVYALALDSADNAVIVGYTRSPDFPTTPGAYDTDYAGDCDAFVARLSADGSTLLHSTFVGGGGNDGAQLLSVDDAGTILFSGFTKSTGFPTTPGVYDQSHNGDFDAFIANLSADLGELLYATFVGGSGLEMSFGLVADSTGNVVIFGYTESSNLPTTAQAYDTTYNGVRDAFLLKLSSDLDALLFSTFLGGGDSDEGSGELVMDAAGNLLMTGLTCSSDFPTTPDAYDDSHNGGMDVFVAKLSADGQDLLYSTFIGGGDEDRGFGITLDTGGVVYLTGYTVSSNFPTTAGAFDTSYNGGGDAFVAKLAKGLNTTWHIETVDSSDDVGRFTSLALDGDGYPHISYGDDTNNDLKYARWMGSSWSIEMLDSPAFIFIACGSSLVLDETASPHIAYGAWGGMWYARQSAFGWTHERAAGHSLAYGVSLQLNQDGNARVSYGGTQGMSINDTALMYAARTTGGEWDVTTLDDNNVGGASLVLRRFGPLDWPAISYYDTTNGRLKYASQFTGWTFATVDSNAGAFNSMAGEHISYYDATNGDLKHADGTESAWTIETVDSYGDVGKYTSLALDTTGNPHISYYDVTNGDLKYAYWTGSDWFTETVDRGGDVGLYTSLALDASDQPHISYYDSTNGDLKYAYKSSTVVNLSGVVFDATTNDPLSSAQIKIGGPSQGITTTVADGQYTFDNLPIGQYWFEASKSGYETVGTLVNVVGDTPYNPLMYQTPSFYEDLVGYYAPVWYQDVWYQDTDSEDFDADYITNFDFDGNWDGTDNWQSQNDGHPLKAYIYYSVIETESHYFIMYADFHPRDWGDHYGPLDKTCTEENIAPEDCVATCHENDMEGVLVVVKKDENPDENPYGQFHLMETVYHIGFKKYSNDENITPGRDSIDGGVLFSQDTHPKVYVESLGHGVKAHDDSIFEDGDGVIYVYEAGNAEEPGPLEAGQTIGAFYDLVPIKDTLWWRRHDDMAHTYRDRTYKCWGRFAEDEALPPWVGARPPWGWTEWTDWGEELNRGIREGDFFFDPAYTVDVHLDGLGVFSRTYVYNPYRFTEVVASVDQGGSLVSNDGSTQVSMPAGMTTASIRVIHTRNSGIGPNVTGSLDTTSGPIQVRSTSESAYLSTSNLSNVGHPFDLNAVYLDTGSPITSLLKPYEITFRHADDEVENVFEDSLELYWWSGSEWIAEPTSVLDEENNTVAATPGHLGIFAVMGTPKSTVYLPLVLRDY